MTQAGDAARGIKALERFWGCSLPTPYGALHAAEIQACMQCSFIPPQKLAEGMLRKPGQSPHFLPIAEASEGAGIYGFWSPPNTEPDRWPVLFQSANEPIVVPMASDFPAFLRSLAITQLYEANDSGPSAVELADTPGRHFAVAFGDRLTELTSPAPRNEREYRERLIASDPLDAVSLCHTGCMWRSLGQPQRALDCFYRAAEAAPYFADPCYLAADVYRVLDDMPRAVEGWWRAVQRPLMFSSYTWEWDLGDDHPEADIHEIAADLLNQNRGIAPDEIKSDPLWDAITRRDPYDPENRLALAGVFAAAGRGEDACRECCNALHLQADARLYDGLGSAYDALIGLYRSQGNRRGVALAEHDRKLDAPND